MNKYATILRGILSNTPLGEYVPKWINSNKLNFFEKWVAVVCGSGDRSRNNKSHVLESIMSYLLNPISNMRLTTFASPILANEWKTLVIIVPYATQLQLLFQFSSFYLNFTQIPSNTHHWENSKAPTIGRIYTEMNRNSWNLSCSSSLSISFILNLLPHVTCTN